MDVHAQKMIQALRGDQPLMTPNARVQQGHGNEFSSPTRPGTFIPDYYRSMGALQSMTGQRSDNDVRLMNENFSQYQDLSPQEKLKWYMNTVGPSPIAGARDPYSVSGSDQNKLADWQNQNTNKIIDAFVNGSGLVKPPISK
jgi:hypothetical protein